MRFNGERGLAAPIDIVWQGLHDHAVLAQVVPGCARMTPLGQHRYSAVLEARVGRIADTYRGRFAVTDVQPGTELRVRVAARGRCGELEVDLYVTLHEGAAPGTTRLRYDAEARVSGLVSRLGSRALGLAGSHFTGSFFTALERHLRRTRVRAHA